MHFCPLGYPLALAYGLLIIQASIDATGSPLTDEALNAAKNADAVLLGAIGGPVWHTPTIQIQPKQNNLTRD